MTQYPQFWIALGLFVIVGLFALDEAIRRYEEANRWDR